MRNSLYQLFTAIFETSFLVHVNVYYLRAGWLSLLPISQQCYHQQRKGPWFVGIVAARSHTRWWSTSFHNRIHAHLLNELSEVTDNNQRRKEDKEGGNLMDELDISAYKYSCLQKWATFAVATASSANPVWFHHRSFLLSTKPYSGCAMEWEVQGSYFLALGIDIVKTETFNYERH